MLNIKWQRIIVLGGVLLAAVGCRSEDKNKDGTCDPDAPQL